MRRGHFLVLPAAVLAPAPKPEAGAFVLYAGRTWIKTLAMHHLLRQYAERDWMDTIARMAREEL